MKKALRIIAEIGSVHDGSFGNALHLIDAAAEAGADAVKFQTHIAEAETLASAPNPGYFKSESRIDYFRRTAFSIGQVRELKARAESRGVYFLSSPFSIEAVDLLEEIGMSHYKIPSGEVSNAPLLERISRTKKPVFLSSGMSSWDELDRAVEILRDTNPLTILQCSSTYPCPPEKVGLNVLAEMQRRYQLPVGYSDHTMGYAAPFAAAAKGAVLIEKHFTFSRLMYGSDAKHSMEPDEFKILCQGLNEIWVMLETSVDKNRLDDFADMKVIFEKSLVTARSLSEGQVLGSDDLAFKKPGSGIKAARYREYVGRKLRQSLPKDHMLREEDFL